MHLRFFLVSLSFECKSKNLKTFVELQIHKNDFVKHFEHADAHDHYAYFRSRMEIAGVHRGLGMIVDSCMMFLIEAASVPVLLSLLVLVFRGGDEAVRTMPTTRSQLYSLALEYSLQRRADKVGSYAGQQTIASVVNAVAKPATDMIRRASIATSGKKPKGAKAATAAAAVPNQPAAPPQHSTYILIRDMLTKVASINHQNGRREFTSINVDECLDKNDQLLWRRLGASQAGVPLVKELEQAVEGVAPALYQFKHLSFQEGLYVRTLLRDEALHQAVTATHDTFATFLNLPFNQNPCRIAAGDFGTMLARQRPHWVFKDSR